MKPVIKIWCLPHNLGERGYVKLHQAVVAEIAKFGVGILCQDDLVVLMPRDLMVKGLGEEIIVEIDSVRINQNHILDAVLLVIRRRFPMAYVQGKITMTGTHGEQTVLHVTM